MNIERIKENYKLACRTNGDFNTKLNDELFEYIYKLENIISGDEVITEKQKELISDQEICIKNTLQSLNEWKEYAERLEELIDKIKKHCKEMITNNKYAYLSQVASETYKAGGHNEVCEEILDLIKEYEEKGI